MRISIVLDEPDLDEVAEPFETAISSWLNDCNCTAELVSADATAGQTVGLIINTSKKAVLKKALDFLYELAQTHKQEFVVGYIEAETEETQKVCYFGHEEGRPDVSEIGSYLGLKR